MIKKAGILLISSDRINLTPISAEDAELIVKWRNNDSVICQMFSSEKITIDKHLKWFENYKASNDRKEFIISIRENSTPIGTIGLSNIDIVNRKAEYGILIGESSFQGKGYASEASIGILKYAFINLNLNKVYLRVFSDNVRAIVLYEKLGFTKEGYFKEEIYKCDKFCDVVIMSILAKDWTNNYENNSCI